MNTSIFVAALDPDGDRIFRFDTDGNQLNLVNTGIIVAPYNSGINDFDVGPDGLMAIASYPAISDAKEIRVVHQNGDLIWAAAHGTGVQRIRWDASGNVYAAGNRTTDLITTRKYDIDGGLLLSLDHGYHVYALAVDASGNIYTGGRRLYDYPCYLKKYNSSGTLQWEYNHGNTITEIAIDSSGDVYFSGGPAWPYVPADPKYNVVKLDGSSGVRQWGVAIIDPSTLVSTNIYPLYLQSDSVLFAAGYTYDASDGSEISAPPGSTFSNFNQVIWAVDSADIEYTAIRSESIIPFGNFGPLNMTTGYKEWTVVLRNEYSDFLNFPVAIRAVDDFMPSMEFSISLKAPTWQGDIYTAVPGLPLGLALFPPIVLRDPQGSFTTLYQLQAYTATDSVQLPIKHFSARKYDQTLSLSVYAAYPTADQWTIMDAGLTQLVILCGAKFPGVALTQWEEMLRVDYDRLRIDAGAQSATLTLEGSNSQRTLYQKSRALSHISYRSHANGKTTLRCDPDTYLDPGDTALLGGGETLLVESISYYSAYSALTMEVVGT